MSFTAVTKSTLGLYEATRPANVVQQTRPSEEEFWGKEGLTFESLLDVVNPLQQLPVVGSIYRAVTGDTLSTGARLAGGALLGGPLGFASALLNVMVEEETGGDITSNVLGLNSYTQSETLASPGTPEGISLYSTHTEAYKRSAYLAYHRANALN